MFLQVEIDNKKEVRKNYERVKEWDMGKLHDVVSKTKLKATWWLCKKYESKKQQTKEGRWDNRKGNKRVFLVCVHIGEEREENRK